MKLPRSLPRRFGLLTLALAATLAAGGTAAEDLLQIYREAQKSDPQIAAARAGWEATQERVPQARSGLLPNVSAIGRRQLQQLRLQRARRTPTPTSTATTTSTT